ncbi:MAG: phosphatase PAP2 family protein [Patescibacteria group bacterium]|nr:phosphatase PAP2 family protein [Patescibacteria group bacterium]
MEYKIVYFFNHLGSGTIVDNFSFYFSWIPFLVVFWFLLALLALIFDKTNGKRIFWGVVLLAVIYFIINDLILKQTLASAFFRQRPYIAHADTIIPLGELFSDSSFPSGHMAITVALSTFFLYFYRKWWIWVLVIIFVLLMAFSRLHNGMHYPTDILAGIIFGLGYGFLTVLISKKIFS